MASRPRLGRSLAGWLRPPDPQGCAPCAPSRTGTRCLSIKQGGGCSKGIFKNGCSASPQGASGRRRIWSVVNTGTP